MAALPYLGYSDYRPITPQHNFALPSHFDQHEDQCYEKLPGRGRPSINPATGRSLLDTTSNAYDVEKAERVDLLLPVRHTSELNFHGYFVDDDAGAKDHVVRRCNVTLFLEDSTLRVYEPRTLNSGYVQGEYLKRSLVLNPTTRRPFAPGDLRIGGEPVHVCGRRIFITDADGLTRQQMELGPATPVPKSHGQWPYSATHHKSPVSVVDGGGGGGVGDDVPAAVAPDFSRKSTLVPPGGWAVRPVRSAVTNFLAHDRQVLRFFGVWRADPRAPDAHAADRNVMVLYYLVDGSIEIVEGRSREDHLTKRVLSRQRVPKPGRERPNCIVHGDSSYIGGYYRGGGGGGTFAADGSGDGGGAFVGPEDLRCGEDVELFGQTVSLQSTDEFTLDWYARHYPRLRQVLPQVYDAPVAAHKPPPADHFNGYGASVDERFARSEDDDGTDDAVVLRFEARLFNPERDPRRLRYGAPTTLLDMQDAERRFVVSFFPRDGNGNSTSSCMVVELPSAVTPGGTFLKRAPYRYHETGRSGSGSSSSTPAPAAPGTSSSSAAAAAVTAAPTAVVARHFRSTDFVPGAVVSFESEPLSGSRLPERNIPAGPASARFVVVAADAFSAEYARKEAVRREHRLQATLDCLRAHLLEHRMSPAWVRAQMRHLGRPRVSKDELRQALLGSLALHPSQAFPSSGSGGGGGGGLAAALELLFDEYGAVDREFGAVMYFDDLIDDLARHPAALAGGTASALSSPAELLAVLETVPALRPRLRACDVSACGLVSLVDVQVVLRQAGVLAPAALVMAALHRYAFAAAAAATTTTASLLTALATTTTARFRYDEMCDACTPVQWAPPLHWPGQQARDAEAERHHRRQDELAAAASAAAAEAAVAPPSSIAAIAGMGAFPARSARGTAAQPPPEHYFYQVSA